MVPSSSDYERAGAATPTNKSGVDEQSTNEIVKSGAKSNEEDADVADVLTGGSIWDDDLFLKRRTATVVTGGLKLDRDSAESHFERIFSRHVTIGSIAAAIGLHPDLLKSISQHRSDEATDNSGESLRRFLSRKRLVDLDEVKCGRDDDEKAAEEMHIAEPIGDFDECMNILKRHNLIFLE